ncbi:unnamed protein product, partial [Porites evermanni]
MLNTLNSGSGGPGKVELYSMEWQDAVDLSLFIVSAAPFGGPIGDFASQSLELHTGKEIILDGPAAADEIQTKNKKYDTQRKHMFLSQRKTKWPWLEYDEEK